MDIHFNLLKTTRQHIVTRMEGLSPEELSAIPAGFSNNIVWNAGHILASQQVLCYQQAGQQALLPDNFIAQFRKGTKPEKEIGKDLIGYIKDQLMHTAEKMEEDYRKGLFKKYTAYETSYGVPLNTIEDAIAFSNTHEALHLGYIMAQRKLLL